MKKTNMMNKSKFFFPAVLVLLLAVPSWAQTTPADNSQQDPNKQEAAQSETAKQADSTTGRAPVGTATSARRALWR